MYLSSIISLQGKSRPFSFRLYYRVGVRATFYFFHKRFASSQATTSWKNKLKEKFFTMNPEQGSTHLVGK